MPFKTLNELSRLLEENKLSCRELVEKCLDRLNDIKGEGSACFIREYSRKAIAASEVSDRMRAHEVRLSPIDGVPVSVKDLFDIKGENTLAGSMVRVGCAPAERDADVVKRLKAAGAIVVGRTNMSEFAYSGVGMNPHYGTPRNPYDREKGRISGGSSSGAAVALADGMCCASIGTDTGGSVRIPAALCGLVGFKPTQSRISRQGVFPLSPSLDTVGTITRSTACAALMDSILTGAETIEELQPFPVAGLRLAVPQTVVLDELDENVARAFENALSYLSRNGVRISEIPLAEIAEYVNSNHNGGLVAAEAYAIHRAQIARSIDAFDPRVLKRIEQGVGCHAWEYIDLLNLREKLSAEVNEVCAEFDALIMPTTPIVAPLISQISDDNEFTRINRLLLRNTSLWNFFNRPAISLPCHKSDEAPVGLMLVGGAMDDRRLFAIAEGVETTLNLMRNN